MSMSKIVFILMFWMVGCTTINVYEHKEPKPLDNQVKKAEIIIGKIGTDEKLNKTCVLKAPKTALKDTQKQADKPKLLLETDYTLVPMMKHKIDRTLTLQPEYNPTWM